VPLLDTPRALSHKSLLSYCNELLNENGTASFVLPKQEGLALLNLLQEMHSAQDSKLRLSRLTYVKTTFNKLASRVLIELSKSSLSKKVDHINGESNELIIHQGEAYSDEFISLTKDFYLKM